VGWYIKRAGSTSYGNQLQANGGSKGFVFIDGVPAVFGTIRAFYSEVAGASFEGTWGADITIAKLECDAATRPFQVINTADGNGGGVIRIGLKIEDGVSAGIPAPGSYCYIEGQYDIEVSMNASFANGAKPAGGHLFVVNPVISGGNAQGSRLQVSGKGFGYVGILKNQATGKTWAGAGDYQAFSFEHYANGDKLFTNCPTLAGGTPPTTPTDPTTPTNPTGPYVDRSLWVISAYNTAPADNFGTHEASKMKDGNTNTWWHSGKPQSATGTDYVPVVFNAPTAIKGIVMDLPDNDFPNDYPDGLVVQVMVNGLWKAVENPVATYGKKTTVSFKSVVAQRFRFATNKAKGPWLCIAELNAIAG
jgi:hypothetical protein